MVTYRYSSWDGSQKDPLSHDMSFERQLLRLIYDGILMGGDLDGVLEKLRMKFTNLGVFSPPKFRIDELRKKLTKLNVVDSNEFVSSAGSSQQHYLEPRLQKVINFEIDAISNRDGSLVKGWKLSDGGYSDDSHGTRPHGSLTDESFQLNVDDLAIERHYEKNLNSLILKSKIYFLENLEGSIHSKIAALDGYSFFSITAKDDFDVIKKLLEEHVPDNSQYDPFLTSFRQILSMSPEEMRIYKEMVHELNGLFDRQDNSESVNYDDFYSRFAKTFGSNIPSTLEEFSKKLKQSFPDISRYNQMESRRLLLRFTRDRELLHELLRLAEFLGMTHEGFQPKVTVPQREEQDSKILVDESELRRALIEFGRKTAWEMEQDFRCLLEDSGYLRFNGPNIEVTPRGARKVGDEALREIFSDLRKSGVGEHRSRVTGLGIEQTGETKTFDSGEPFNINIHRSLLNAVLRNGKKVPVELIAQDLAVDLTEHFTRAATVIMIDQSRSMGMFGSFRAAKTVILALESLIRGQFPRDYFRVVGFSDYAVTIEAIDLHKINWNASVSGTNMQHGLQVARRLLSNQRAENKQIIMITDGEPTAHLEKGQAYFSYPPSWRTMDNTLREVLRCTRDGIVINTFMLDYNMYLVDFVDKLTRINRGRAFYTQPNKLGRYLMVDYLRNVKKLIK